MLDKKAMQAKKKLLLEAQNSVLSKIEAKVEQSQNFFVQSTKLETKEPEKKVEQKEVKTVEQISIKQEIPHQKRSVEEKVDDLTEKVA